MEHLPILNALGSILDGRLSALVFFIFDESRPFKENAMSCFDVNAITPFNRTFLFLLDFNKIGNFFGNLAKKTGKFFKCMFPKLFGQDACFKQAINSVKSTCGNANTCKVVIGGPKSNCLRIRRYRPFSYKYGKAS